MTRSRLYEAGRRDAALCDINPEVRLIHNTTGMVGDYLRGWRDYVNEQREARGLTTFYK